MEISAESEFHNAAESGFADFDFVTACFVYSGFVESGPAAEWLVLLQMRLARTLEEHSP